MILCYETREDGTYQYLGLDDVQSNQRFNDNPYNGCIVDDSVFDPYRLPYYTHNGIEYSLTAFAFAY